MMKGISFDGKREWVDTGAGFASYPLGSALLSYISSDKPESHPLLSVVWEEDVPETLRQTLQQAAEMVLAEGENTPVERLWDFFEAQSELAAMRDGLVARRVFTRGEDGMESRLFLTSHSLAPLLFASLEQMAEEKLSIRRCAYCGGYFVPYSSRALYCDRIVGESGKTCKDLAARAKYEQKIADDAPRALFQRRNKAYAMRVRRDPVRFDEASYQAWRAYGEMALRSYEQGKLSMELLSLVLELPEG